ncbi:hypothetical protein ACFE04_028588 [Oxalis oulophora]
MATGIVIRRLFTTTRKISSLALSLNKNIPFSSSTNRLIGFSLKPISLFSTSLTPNTRFAPHKDHDSPRLSSEETSGNEDDYVSDGWEDDDDPEAEPKIGDGGDGGGVVLQDIPWGKRALSLANEALLQFGNDMALYSFKITPRGYVYVRLDKLSNEYGCPSMDELENYSQQYKKRLDEVGALGELPDDLALEVSTPGAERILKVPEDLDRFKDMPMSVCYVEESDTKNLEKTGIFKLESVEEESGKCVWKLAEVKENRDPQSKGRPMSRKRKDWRLTLPFTMHNKVTLYLEY